MSVWILVECSGVYWYQHLLMMVESWENPVFSQDLLKTTGCKDRRFVCLDQRSVKTRLQHFALDCTLAL